MAVGIGLSLYLFSYANTMLHKDLSFEDGDTLIKLHSSRNGFRNQGELNLHDYNEIRQSLKGISEFSTYTEQSVNISGRDGARRFNATLAEPNFFRMTRVKPVLGREFSQVENQKNAEPVVVIGHDIWQNQFLNDPKVIDQSIRIDGVNHRIIGVMPQGYYFPGNAEIWMPMKENVRQVSRNKAGRYYGVAHLKEDASEEDINRQLSVIMKRIEEVYPKTNGGISAYATTFPMSLAGNSASLHQTMNIVAVLILILASINVGNLLLSRAVERRKETAIRVALGAPRSRLITQMLWESIIICTIGGVIGLAATSWGLEISEEIKASYSANKPIFWWKFGIDLFTIKLFFSIVIGTILVTGLVPAWRNSGADFNSALRDGTRGALGKKAGRLNRVLAISEIFLSIAVMIATGLIVVGNYKAITADFGVEPNKILTASLRLNENYDSLEKQSIFVDKLQSRLEASPGIGNVAIATALPSEYTRTQSIAIEGREYDANRDTSYPIVNYISLTTGSLEKLGVELKEGRYFNSGDKGADKRSVIVTESFTSRHFANESPIGKRIQLVGVDGDLPNWITIVGVVEHTIHGHATGTRLTRPALYRPFSQAPQKRLTIATQMKSDAHTISESLHKALASIDSELAAYAIESYDEKIGHKSAPLIFMGMLGLLFAIAAFILAASGIFAVVSNSISQRTQEIGVKRALGAWEQLITKEFLFAGFRQLLWGGIPGIAAGCTMGYALAKMTGDGYDLLPIIAFVMFIIISIVVMLATYLPTKKALEMEPNDALHYE